MLEIDNIKKIMGDFFPECDRNWADFEKAREALHELRADIQKERLAQVLEAHRQATIKLVDNYKAKAVSELDRARTRAKKIVTVDAPAGFADQLAMAETTGSDIVDSEAMAYFNKYASDNKNYPAALAMLTKLQSKGKLKNVRMLTYSGIEKDLDYLQGSIDAFFNYRVGDAPSQLANAVVYEDKGLVSINARLDAFVTEQNWIL